MRLNISAGLWCFGNFSDRYVPRGYYNNIALSRQLEIFSKIEGLDGLGIIYPTDPLPNDPDKLIKKLNNYNLRIGDISVDNYSNRKWKHGAFSTNEKKVRMENIKLCKEAIDFASEIPDTNIMLWPAHDGFDYPFQVYYRDGWGNLVESLIEICEYKNNKTIILEYKCKDPRQKQYISNIGKMLMLFKDVGADNLKGCIDIGHALMSQENLAENVVILDKNNKLGAIHLNENYRDSDPDLIFGTINFWENLEMLYYLNKTGFIGWNEIDIVSSRDDRIKSLSLAVKLARKYEKLAGVLFENLSNKIDSNLKRYYFSENMNLITDIILNT